MLTEGSIVLFSESMGLWTPSIVCPVPLSKGPNKVGVPLSSPEDRNRSCFRNIVFSNYLEFRMMGGDNKASYSEYSSTKEVQYG
jgi:hypothetical protein